MKLTYNDNVAIINALECEIGITKLARNNIKFDLVITSPPYFDARNYGGKALFSDTTKWGDWCTGLVGLIADNILKSTGVIWWNTGSGYRDHHKLAEVYKMVSMLDARGIYLIDEIPWIKTSAPPKRITNRPYSSWEHNFIFSKHPEQVVFNRDDVRRPYAKATLERMKYVLGKLTPDSDGEYENNTKRVEPNPGGASPRNYLILSQDYTKRPHPAPMSPELANWAIRAYSPVGGWVFDPMMGIGTSMIESFKLGRNFVGFDLYKEYLDIAKLSFDRLVRGDGPYNGLKNEWESMKNETVGN